jgi:hypothetical protein
MPAMITKGAPDYFDAASIALAALNPFFRRWL